MNKIAFMLILLLFVFASFTFVAAQDKPVALFVINDVADVIKSDQLLGDALASWGFDVLWMSAVEVAPGDADGAAIVLISSSTLSTQVGDKFTAAEVGVLTWEGGLYDDLFMCSGPAWGISTMNTDFLTIVDPGNPLAGGLSGDVVVVTESPQEYTIIMQDSLIESGMQIATMIDDIGDKHTVIVGFEKGVILYDGSKAAGRRCGFFMRDNTASVLMDEGWLLVKAAVEWTAGRISTRVESRGSESPGASRLLANYPNPFNPSTGIPFTLANQSNVRIDVYDVLGRHVKTLVAGDMAAGQYEAAWNGVNEFGDAAPSGLYFVKMRTTEAQSIQKILLTR